MFSQKSSRKQQILQSSVKKGKESESLAKKDLEDHDDHIFMDDNVLFVLAWSIN